MLTLMKRLAVMAVIITLSLAAFQREAQAQAGALTFGAVLNQLASKVGGLIDKAANAGEVIEAGAGGQIAIAIANAKTAYKDSLDLTIDRLDVEKTKVLNDLTTQVGYLEHDAIVELKKIADHGAVAVNAIPLSKTFPQVSRTSPTYTALDSESLDIEIIGNFFDAARSGYMPTLKIGDKSFSPRTNTVFRLVFTVDAKALKKTSDKLSYVDMILSVPYRNEVAWLFHRREVATFRFETIVLPEKVGIITFGTDHLEARRESRQKAGPEHIQESSHDDIPDPIGSGRVWYDSPTPGWFVDPASVSLKVNWAEGDWKNFGNRSNPANAGWSIATVHHGIGTSGKIHFQLVWTEYRDTAVHVPGEQRSELIWGSSRTFTVPANGSWKAHFKQFDGREFDITSAAFKNPYIQVQTSGNSVTIVTIP